MLGDMHPEPDMYNWECPVCNPKHVISRYTETALQIGIDYHIQSHDRSLSVNDKILLTGMKVKW